MAEIIVTGKTVDEAVEEGCRQLGLTRDEIRYEILEMPQKVLFFSKPAKVKVSKVEEEFSVHDLLYGGDTVQQQKKEKKERKEKDSKEKKNQKQQQKEKKKQEENGEKQQKKQEKPTKSENEEKAAASAEKKEKKKKNKPEKKQENTSKKEETAETAEDDGAAETILEMIQEQDLPERAVHSLEFLKQIAAAYGAENVEYSFARTERGVCIMLSGEDAPMLIGRRGELMDAIQYLCTVGSSREGGDYCRVSLDIEGYRSRREKSLQELAARTASKVKKNRRSQTLDAMNPYERAIVHAAVQKIDGVSSHSVGSEPHRKVVITLDGAQERRSRGNRRSGKFDRSESSDRTEQSGSETASAPKVHMDIPVKKELKSTEEFIGNLYGKIEL